MKRHRSIVKEHFLRTLAEQSAGAPDGSASGVAHAMMQAALWADMRALKETMSIARKIELKRVLLPKYAAYCDGVLQGNAGAQDDVLMNVMAWRLDTGDLAGGIAIGEYALRHGLRTPDRFVRSTPALLAEQVAEESAKRLPPPGGDHARPEPEEAEALLWQLLRVRQLTASADMHDQIRAKLYKSLGYAFALKGKLNEAVKALKDALALHSSVGVKKDIERIERMARANPAR